MRYHLYRTTELEGYLDWEHLKQVWRIEKERVKQSGQVERGHRYYVTSVRLGRFKPEQILQVVRAHWGIENNCNWTMDVVWDQDQGLVRSGRSDPGAQLIALDGLQPGGALALSLLASP